MTLETFLEKLEQTPRDWYRNEWGSIRRGREKDGTDCYHCPLTQVCGGSVTFPRERALAAGLSHSEINEIVAAADDAPCPALLALRAKLLKACGLEAQS